MDLLPGLIYAKDPGKEYYLNSGKDNQAECPAPEIQLINHASAQKKNRRLAKNKTHHPKYQYIRIPRWQASGFVL